MSSAEDFAVLEAEYQSNPRPEKALRLEIVNRVSLTEKEVQVCVPLTPRYTHRKQMVRVTSTAKANTIQIIDLVPKPPPNDASKVPNVAAQ